MSTAATWGLIGHGNIGRQVVSQISQPHLAKRLGLKVSPEFIVKSSGIMQGDGVTPTKYKKISDLPELPDVVFVAIPSSDDGKMAYDYISYILQHGKLVVTAEKGSVANYFAALKTASDNFNRLGITATVGGGTRLLQVAREYCKDVQNITQIHLAMNGTLSAIMDWVAPLQGEKLDIAEAAKMAAEKGYAEPGSTSATAIIRGEAEGDIPKKLAIFYNSVRLSRKLLDWNALRFSLSDSEINQALNSEVQRRFLVSIYPQSYVDSRQDFFEDDIIGGFSVEFDGWRLVGGFRRIDANPLFSALTSLTGPGNGMVIGLGPLASDGVYAITGPGAGVKPTVNTMLDDYLGLKSFQEI